MKKQISITQFTVAADNSVALHKGNSNDRPIAAASSSVNSSSNVFEALYQPEQTYCFPKRLFGKRPFQSAWFTSYSWFHYQPESDAVIYYICVKHNQNGDLDSITNRDPRKKLFNVLRYIRFLNAIKHRWHMKNRCRNVKMLP